MNSIPKKIHYVWVGNAPKPDLVIKCIESWKKYLPDYEIIEWGNETVSLIDNQYLKDAYQHQKWAFVSDVIRLYALYHHGGIYLDTDVEVRQSLDSFLDHDFFTGHEVYNNQCLPVITAVLGAKPQNTIIKALLDNYDAISFIEGNQFNMMPNTERVTQYFKESFNINPPYNAESTIELLPNSYIYPYYYFCTPKPNAPSYTIHLFDGSWIPGFARRDKLKLFNLAISRFKRVAKNDALDLGIKDKVIFSIPVSKNLKYALILKG